MNRGVGKRPLFERRDDARFFLARLAREVRAGRIEVHAYCVMVTHFHLLVRSPLGEVSEAMRRVQNEHSRRFNRRRKRDGTLIRGRYFSKPVLSLRYRQTLVRYIDDNPVRAGIVRRPDEYDLGSAYHYMRKAGPIWLTRDWVEREACQRAGTDHFTPGAYARAFCGRGSAEVEELVQARLASTALEDPLDDLIGAAPDAVRAWLQRKADNADAYRVDLPVCGPTALRTVLAEHVGSNGTWMVEDGRSVRRGPEMALVGLLRELCGVDWQTIAVVAGSTLARVRRIGDHHRRLIQRDESHAAHVSAIAHAAILHSR